MSARTLSEREAELVFMLGSAQQKRCSGDKYSRLIDLEIIPASRMEVFLHFLQQLVRSREGRGESGREAKIS